MSQHAELIARLEAAKVGARELDALIWDIEEDRPRHSLDGDFPVYKRDPEDDVAFDAPPPYTASLDAALALAERIVPSVQGADHRKSEVRMQYGDFGCNAYIDRDTFSGDHMFMGSGKTPALALCAAILKALEAKQ